MMVHSTFYILKVVIFSLVVIKYTEQLISHKPGCFGIYLYFAFNAYITLMSLSRIFIIIKILNDFKCHPKCVIIRYVCMYEATRYFPIENFLKSPKGTSWRLLRGTPLAPYGEAPRSFTMPPKWTFLNSLVFPRVNLYEAHWMELCKTPRKTHRNFWSFLYKSRTGLYKVHFRKLLKASWSLP